MILVKKEMAWTVKWFEHQQVLWEKRLDNAVISQSRGHQCYAEKQIILWSDFAASASKEFDKLCNTL
jgi:hypothetical protein